MKNQAPATTMRQSTLDKLKHFWPLLLFFLIIPGVYFLFIYGLSMTHDGATHLLRIARLDEHLRDGVLFTRWLPDLLLGYGYPVLNYYAASTYYLVEGFHLLGLNLYYAFIVAEAVLMYLAAVGMYLFARDLFGHKAALPALVTTIAYVYAPYLLINIYVRGAIAELGAQMLLPWILWSFRRIWLAPNPRQYILLAIFTLGSLAWTHTISLLIIPLLLVAYMLLLLSIGTKRWSRVGWSALAIIGAVGISCFYWLPLIVERKYISDVGFTISKNLMLPISFINWHKFIDMGWLYSFPEDPPFRFSLLQVGGTLFGLLFLWRRPREIWFWVGVMAFCIFMMTDISRPLWFSNDFLPIIQFPWRLQAILQFPIAIVFGLPLTVLHNNKLRAASALLIITLLIRVHSPSLPWAYILSPASKFDMSINAYFEAERTHIVDSGWMTSTVQEFRPKWTTQTLTLDRATVAESSVVLNGQTTVNATHLTLLAADPFHLSLQIAGDRTFPLRFTTYFFPGWTATLDQATNLPTYPSTNLGLLTVDIPAGTHTLTIAWKGTLVAAVAGLISQIVLLLVVLWQLSLSKPARWWSIVPLGCLFLGLTATYVQPSIPKVEPGPPIDLPGLQLMGYHKPILTNDSIHMQIYWLVTETPPAALAIRWQLRADDKTTAAETVSAPFYDSYSSQQWGSSTIVDDEYIIPLPTHLVPGHYTIVMTPFSLEGEAVAEEIVVGTVMIPKLKDVAPIQNGTEVYFGDNLVLRGFNSHVVERLLQPDRHLLDRPDITVVNSGQTLKYTLFWQTEQETNEPFVSFVHLTDHAGQPLVQHDHLPGPLFLPPGIWATYNQYPDQFLLEIPKEAASGLYRPNVGFYNWKDLHRLDVRMPGVEGIGDHFELPAVKVVNRKIRSQGIASRATFGTLAELMSFSVKGDTKGVENNQIIVNPGQSLSLTTYYRVAEASEQELHRFVQVRNASDQMLTQFDSEPQNGLNPTWAWLPGEIVQDTIALQIPEDAAIGDYTLYLGFYHPNGNLERLSVLDDKEPDLGNREYPLLKINVTTKVAKP